MTVYMVLLPVYSMHDDDGKLSPAVWTTFAIVTDLEEAKTTAGNIHGIVVTLHEAP